MGAAAGGPFFLRSPLFSPLLFLSLFSLPFSLLFTFLSSFLSSGQSSKLSLKLSRDTEPCGRRHKTVSQRVFALRGTSALCPFDIASPFDIVAFVVVVSVSGRRECNKDVRSSLVRRRRATVSASVSATVTFLSLFCR